MGNLKRSLSNGKRNICTFQCYNKSDSALFQSWDASVQTEDQKFLCPPKGVKKSKHTHCNHLFFILHIRWNTEQ